MWVLLHCGRFERNEISFRVINVMQTLPRKKSPKTKHLRMWIFHKNKCSESKDQNKNEFYLISPAMKTNVNRIFSMTKWNFILCKVHFESHVNSLSERSQETFLLESIFAKDTHREIAPWNKTPALRKSRNMGRAFGLSNQHFSRGSYTNKNFKKIKQLLIKLRSLW